MAGAGNGASAGARGDAGWMQRLRAPENCGPDDIDESPFEPDESELGSIDRWVERTIGEARVIDARGARLLLRETAAFARADPPRIMLQAVVDGRPTYFDGLGGQTMLKPGCLIIRRADEAAAIRSDRFARVVTVALARHLLAPRYATAEAIDDCGVQADNSLPQRLLHSFIVGLGEAEGASEPILMTGPMTAVVDGLGGLVSMILAQRPQPPAELSELAAARAAELLGYLRRNFANPHLTPSMMADDLHISVRYAHKLMQMTGRSFREELVRLRLEAARLAFAAGRRPRQTIADIAISVGFNDLSQFNRHFRAAFGMTPRSARKLDETNGYGSPGDEGGGWTNTVSWRQAPSSPSSLGGAPAMAVASASRPL